MIFIKKIVDKKVDSLTHMQFQKFSRGSFTNRALFKAKNSAGMYTISTSAEFANELVRIVADKLGEEKTDISGVIVSTNDLSGELDFKDKKQFQGVKKYVIENQMSGKEIISLLNKFPKAFFGLSFSAAKDETKLKIKPKAPKSGKPGSKGEETPKIDFCKIITKDKKLAEAFVFEKPDFKSAEIIHDFLINEIVVPSELKDSQDFARVREEARKKGKIIRKGEIDGQKIREEIDFEA